MEKLLLCYKSFYFINIISFKYFIDTFLKSKHLVFKNTIIFENKVEKILCNIKIAANNQKVEMSYLLTTSMRHT